jgi:HAD superfamily hydrolase (TIGR01509 family)
MIKAVIFDVDGVLLDSFEANFKFQQDLMAFFGYKPPTKEEYAKAFHLTLMEVIQLFTKSKSQKEIQKIWKVGKSRQVPYPIDLLRLPKNIDEVLEALGKKYKLALVTNRVKEGVYDVPQLASFLHHFQTIVTYENTTKHKPDPEPLLLAVKKLNVKPEETVYIGDAESDMKAAKRAGMKMIFYSKSTSFQKLPELVSSLK